MWLFDISRLFQWHLDSYCPDAIEATLMSTDKLLHAYKKELLTLQSQQNAAEQRCGLVSFE